MAGLRRVSGPGRDPAGRPGNASAPPAEKSETCPSGDRRSARKCWANRRAKNSCVRSSALRALRSRGGAGRHRADTSRCAQFGQRLAGTGRCLTARRPRRPSSAWRQSGPRLPTVVLLCFPGRPWPYSRAMEGSSQLGGSTVVAGGNAHRMPAANSRRNNTLQGLFVLSPGETRDCCGKFATKPHPRPLSRWRERGDIAPRPAAKIG